MIHGSRWSCLKHVDNTKNTMAFRSQSRHHVSTWWIHESIVELEPPWFFETMGYRSQKSALPNTILSSEQLAHSAGLRVSQMPWGVYLATYALQVKIFETAILQVLHLENTPARPSQPNCSLTRLCGIFPMSEGKGVQ